MSEKRTQVLNLNPSTDLVFKGPFTEVVTSTLTLQNPTNESVIFKVKTTAPRQYCVRPNSGLLNSLDSVVINVMLQPLDGPTGDRTKHKFMVQTMYAPPGFQIESLDTVWKESSKSQMMDSKLRCVFVEGLPSSTPEVPVGQSSNPPLRSPSDEPVQPDEIPSAPAPVDTNTKPEPQPQERPEVVPSVGESLTPSVVGENMPAVKAATDSKLRLLQNKVDELAYQNKQLQSENSKIRQRLNSGGARNTGPGAGLKGGDSVSPKKHLSLVAIMLILVAIVLGYLVGKWL